jgi:hypothetical protein
LVDGNHPRGEATLIYHSFRTGDILKLRPGFLINGIQGHRWLVHGISQESKSYRLIPWNPIAKKWADSWLPDTIAYVDANCVLDLDMEEAPW